MGIVFAPKFPDKILADNFCTRGLQFQAYFIKRKKCRSYPGSQFHPRCKNWKKKSWNWKLGYETFTSGNVHLYLNETPTEWPDDFVKKMPKMLHNLFLVKVTVDVYVRFYEKVAKIWPTYKNLNKLPKVNKPKICQIWSPWHQHHVSAACLTGMSMTVSVTRDRWYDFPKKNFAQKMVNNRHFGLKTPIN
jgi:hypothetical protein